MREVLAKAPTRYGIAAMLPSTMKPGDKRLSFITMLNTFGSVQDALARGAPIESFSPPMRKRRRISKASSGYDHFAGLDQSPLVAIPPAATPSVIS